MKNVTMYLILSLLAVSVAFAFKTKSAQEHLSYIQMQQETRVKLEEKDVPEQVLKGLEESDYGSYEVSEIYKVTEESETMYEFTLEVESVKWAVYFDQQGKYMGKKEKD